MTCWFLCRLVRCPTPTSTEDDAPSGAAKKKKGLTSLSKAGAASAALAGKKKAKTMWQRMTKFLFSWARTTFKVNGKKLLPHTTFLWRYMVSGRGSCSCANSAAPEAWSSSTGLHLLGMRAGALCQLVLGLARLTMPSKLAGPVLFDTAMHPPAMRPLPDTCCYSRSTFLCPATRSCLLCCGWRPSSSSLACPSRSCRACRHPWPASTQQHTCGTGRVKDCTTLNHLISTEGSSLCQRPLQQSDTRCKPVKAGLSLVVPSAGLLVSCLVGSVLLTLCL